MKKTTIGRLLAAACGAWAVAMACSTTHAFSLTWSIANPTAFTVAQRAILETALDEAVALWERHITGYQPGISLSGVSFSVFGQTSGFASAQMTGSATQGGFRLATSGRLNVNVTVLEPFSDYEGTGLNVIDELMAHEIGHILGIGPLWSANGVYVPGSGRYTGQHGLAAYRAEFDPLAEFIPVELAGNPGTPDYHWDQLMRSSPQEGNPADPWSLDPRLGIEDDHGRDLALELMTGALDPDFGAPYLSRTTIASLRDLGFTVVVPEPASWALFFGAASCATARRIRRTPRRAAAACRRDICVAQRPALLLGFVSCVAAGTAQAAALHVDAFAATTEGWIGGAGPTWVASGGPAGADDGYLQISSAGTFLAVYNNDPRWVGDFATLGATHVNVDLRNAGPDELAMRLVLFGPGSTAVRWTSATPAVVPADGAWRNYRFDIDAASLVKVLGEGTFDAMLANVVRVMLRHDPANPSAGGEGVQAALGIDNVALAEAAAGLAADFDASGVVDGADFALWEGAWGVDAGGDANGDGATSGADLLVWQQQFGAASSALTSVPEPAAPHWAAGCVTLGRLRRRHRRLSTRVV